MAPVISAAVLVMALTAGDLPPRWVLTGAQMTMLHALAADDPAARPDLAPSMSADADQVMDIRADPGHLEAAHDVLTAHGFSQEMSGLPAVGHRYRRGAASIDLMAPDGVRQTTPRLGSSVTIQRPGCKVSYTVCCWGGLMSRGGYRHGRATGAHRT